MTITNVYFRHQSTISTVSLLLIILLSGFQQALVQAQTLQRPLTLEGKEALYQRVIAVPDARLAMEMGDTGTETVTPFTIFYVYARDTLDGTEWLQVGTKNNGSIVGWLPAAEGIDWKQNLTVSFKDPAVQERVLLFGDRSSLKQMVDTHNVDEYRELQQRATQGITADSPVIAMQPDHYINIRRNFYLVPILSHEDILIGNHPGRLLEVATVPLQDPGTGYRAGVMFAIDTTISMGPYIDRTRAIMQRVYESIETADLAERVSFGLVGFRDNISAVPDLDYTTRLYSNLADAGTGQEFLSRTEAVEPARVSSRGFNEDAYAGIKQAIDDVDWSGYDARYVILITDAGPRVGGDGLAATGLDTPSLHRLARDNDIALWVMHLRTPEGEGNHAYAEDHYRRLSHIDNIGDFYYPVETGDVNSFEQALSAMTDQLTNQVAAIRSVPRPETIAAARPDQPEQLTEFQDKVAKLGYALRMRYLQSGSGSVPQLFNAWMVDRVFEDPGKQSMDVRVLLTRDQLSDLHEVLRQVLITAEEGTLSPRNFLDELKSLAATFSRDPEAATSVTGGTSLAELGYLREYIEDLPYQSVVMDLDLSTWQQWSAQQQFEFINKLEGKIAYYLSLHSNVDLWVSLDGGPVDGDSVYPLLLEALP